MYAIEAREIEIVFQELARVIVGKVCLVVPAAYGWKRVFRR
jgi:hypothetical protein